MSRNCNEEQVICSFVYVQIYNFEQRTYHRCGLARTLLDDKVCDVFNPVSDILLVCFATGLESGKFRLTQLLFEKVHSSSSDIKLRKQCMPGINAF